MRCFLSAGPWFAVLASLVACADRNDASAASAAVPALDPAPLLLLDPVAVALADAQRVTLRTELAAPALPALAGAVDPCVLRLGDGQRSLVPTLRDGGIGIDLPASLPGAALVGLSVGATASAPARHAKAIVAAAGTVAPPHATPAVTARLGLLAELTPLVDPSASHPGDDVPVRLAVDLGNARGIEVVVAHRAPGVAPVRSATRTGDDAVAVVRLTGPGSYALSARVVVGKPDGTSEPAETSLTFVVGEGKR